MKEYHWAYGCHATLDFRCTEHSEQYRYTVRVKQIVTPKVFHVSVLYEEMASSNTVDTHHLGVMVIQHWGTLLTATPMLLAVHKYRCAIR